MLPICYVKGVLMKNEDRTINGICSQVGISPVSFNEVLRRIRRVVVEEDAQVISKIIGTFYRRDSKATTRTLNGVVYDIPARSCVQLRPNKVVDVPDICSEQPLQESSGLLADDIPQEFEGSFPGLAVGARMKLLLEVTDAGDIVAAGAARNHPAIVSSVSLNATGSPEISTSLFGINSLLNGGFRFGYTDHPQEPVSLGDKFGLVVEVVEVSDSGLVDCRIDRVLNGVASTSVRQTFSGCDIEVSFLSTNPDTSLLFDLPDGASLFPRAQSYEVVVG